jgi:hypothetical protein
VRANYTYQHINTIDTILEVLKIQYIGPKYIKLTGRLMNKFNGIVYEVATYTIGREELEKWEMI